MLGQVFSYNASNASLIIDDDLSPAAFAVGAFSTCWLVYLVSLPVFARVAKKGASAAQAAVAIVGLCHAVQAVARSGYVLLSPEADALRDDMYAKSTMVAHTFAISLGFFTWEICMELFVLPTVTSSCTDVPQVAHGVACAICYLLGLWPAPFLAWMGSVMLLNEASTVPLTVRRVMLECGWSKGALYDAVQLAFAGLFLGVRIGVALPVSVWWWPQMLQLLRSGEVHSYGVGVYFLVANLLLTGLNIFWAFLICKKMAKAISGGKKKD